MRIPFVVCSVAVAASAWGASSPESLQRELDAAPEGGVVTLSEDVCLPGGGSVRVPRSLTLDLGGHRLANSASGNLVLSYGKRLVVLNGTLENGGQSCLVPSVDGAEVYVTNCTLRGSCSAYSGCAGTRVVFGAGTRIETAYFMSGHPTCKLTCVADGCVNRSGKDKDGEGGVLQIVELEVPPLEDPERPQLHFTPPRLWMNDPNGLSFYKGEWHLFYQYKKHIRGWAQANWGHAVSTDLVAWQHLPIAIEAIDNDGAWSGSGFTDADGIAGFGKGEHLLYYTWATPELHSVCIAHSGNGRDYLPYEGNPVVKADRTPDKGGSDRDPWVFWHAKSRRWVMLVYSDKRDENDRWVPYYIVYNSTDLRNWQEVNRLYTPFAECPCMVEFPIKGETGSAWVFFGAGNTYWVGDFDGRDFKLETQAEGWYGGLNEWYAGQIFNDAPDGRKVFAAWAKFDLPEGSKRVFNQGLSLLQELTLARTPRGLRLKRFPVKEYEKLRVGPVVRGGEFEGELAEVRVKAKIAPGGRLEMSLRGVTLVYDNTQKALSCGGNTHAWPLTDEWLELAIWVDRMGIDVFDLSGLQCLPVCRACPDPVSRAVCVTGSRHVSDVCCKVWKLRSIYDGGFERRTSVESK